MFLLNRHRTTDNIDKHIGDAYHQGLSVLDACDKWYSDAFLMEIMPSAIYILMQRAHNLKEAIIRAVNDIKDNDTIAVIVGVAVGEAVMRAYKKT